MANVTAFVDVTNIAQYTSSQVSHDAPPLALCLSHIRSPSFCPVRVPCADQPCWHPMCTLPNKSQHHLQDLLRCLLTHEAAQKGSIAQHVPPRSPLDHN